MLALTGLNFTSKLVSFWNCLFSSGLKSASLEPHMLHLIVMTKFTVERELVSVLPLSSSFYWTDPPPT